MQLQIVAAKPWNKWNDATNKPGEQVGNTYTVLKLKMRGPILMDVKVPGITAVISGETLRENFKEHIITWGDFRDVEEDSYVDKKGALVYYATAAAVTVLFDDVLDYGGKS